MKSRTDKILEIVIVFALIGLLFEGIYVYYHWPREIEFSQSQKTEGNKELIKSEQPPKENLLKETILPDSFTLDIPFFPQAPLGNWNPPFDHACEEAAILMVHYYFQDKSIDFAKVAQEIRDIVDFEKKTYGFYKDTSAEQTAQLMRDYYGYKIKVQYDISLRDIKKELVKGNPVIVPAAGRLLGNPYFTPPGPTYHMLVIKGYTQAEFITNDPGTKRGADFIYANEILDKAIRDYGESSQNGRKAMLVIYSPNKVVPTS